MRSIELTPSGKQGGRFMDALAYSYGVTRGRGMTQCISASLLALDRWSLPNATVRSSILGRKLANFMLLAIYRQGYYWKIVNVITKHRHKTTKKKKERKLSWEASALDEGSKRPRGCSIAKDPKGFMTPRTSPEIYVRPRFVLWVYLEEGDYVQCGRCSDRV